MEKKTRKKRKFARPNPLFESWLMEWKEDAGKKKFKSEYIFAKALKSLKKYPLPLSSGKEAKILEHFGDKICAMLDDRLQQYQKGETPLGSLSDVSFVFSGEESQPQLFGPTKTYSSSSETTSKKPAEPSKVVTSDIHTENNLFHFHVPSTDDSTSLFDMNNLSEEQQFSLNPGCFDVLLCVDNCETLTSGHGKSKAQFLLELKKHGVDFEVRKLNVGDFVWVARERKMSSGNAPCHELVLDFVIERKRMDDLAHSIKDGRFREQKFRMRNCGLRRPVYLVEAHKCSYYGLPESTLEQAIVNTQVVDGFLLKKTKGIKDSVEYLSLMTKYLQNLYQEQTLISGTREVVQNANSPANMFMSFKEFNSTSVKNKCLKVSEMFAKHLLQIFGLSVDRAATIVEKYEAPSKLFQAYLLCSSEEEKIKMLSTLKFGKYQKNIGLALSKTIHQLYCTRGLLP